MIKIQAPSNYTGASVYGNTTLTFKDGVAEVDSLSKEVGLWLKNKGYKMTRVKGKNSDSENKDSTAEAAKEGVNNDDS